MEFFADAQRVMTAEEIQAEITGPRLAEFCDSIDEVISWDVDTDRGEMYCLWGQFDVNREVVKRGLRFTLPGCPNALAWTVTAEPRGTVIHCTINQHVDDPDFLESLETFVADWQSGLTGSDCGAIAARA